MQTFRINILLLKRTKIIVMRATIKNISLFVSVLLLSVSAYAQRGIPTDDNEPNYLIFMSHDEAGREIIQVTDITQQVRFHDPQAPRFVLTDSNGNFSLGIGGRVRAVAEYDFGGILDNVDFYPSQIVAPGNGNYSKNQFQMDASSSSLFLKLVGKTKKLGNFVVYVNGYFRGSGSTFRLHHAYASFLGFTAGYDYGIFTDAATAASTVDFQGPAGQILYRTTQLRYNRVLSKNWSFGIAVEVPQVNATTTDELTVNTQRTPDFPAYIQYNWGNNSHFRLAGIIRTMNYNNTVEEKVHTQTGWGVQGSTMVYPFEKLKVIGQVSYGKGISHLYNDLGNLNADLVPNPENPGRMQVLPMLGWYAGLQYNFNPKVFVSSTYSQARVYSQNQFPAANSDMYRYGQYLVANVFWNFSSNLQFGAEYLRGWRTTHNSDTFSSNRVSVLMQYSF